MTTIFQLKITLLKTKPSIWRRVQINGYRTFWDLHVVIRDTFEWRTSQIHYFEIVDSKREKHRINSFLDDYENNTHCLSWNVGLRKFFLNKKNKIYYVFGVDQNFKHKIVLEKNIYKNPIIDYPICLAGFGLAYEQDEQAESSTEEKIRALRKFKPSDVVPVEGTRALVEHKVRLLDSLYY